MGKQIRLFMRFSQPILLTALLLAVSPVRGNLIINGSFEFPLVPTGFYTNFSSGSTAITGWTVVGVDSAVVDRNFQNGGITFQTQDGNQWLDLAGITSNSMSSGVTQTIATTVDQNYEVSFYVGSATNGSIYFPATVRLSIGGGAPVSYFNPSSPTTQLDWRRFAVNFTATEPTTRLTFFNGSASNNYLSGLDNVSVVPISGIPGDFDFDGDVDGRDFLIWQRGGSPTSQSAIDLADWQGNYGVGTLTAANTAVPEPSTMLMAAFAMTMVSFVRQRCHGS
jgi:hypothetical protein